MNLVAMLIGWGVPAKLAKPVLIAAGVLLLGLAILAAVKLHDRRVIDTHEAKQEAATSKADRQADAHAAVERRVDDSRSTDETTQIKEAINEARRTGADPRAAYYACVRRQQAARSAGKPSPDC